MMNKQALIIVDVQNDFCPGGSLPVPGGDRIVEPINELIAKFQNAGAVVIATRDWHPSNHSSFSEQGGPWPVHCVQGTPGAEFHPDLKINKQVVVISKATTADKDAYSGFDGTNLESLLRDHKISKVFICGLATDYCVKATVLDALKAGFETYVVQDAVRGVDVNAGDSEEAINEMLRAGAKTIRSAEIVFASE